MPRRIAADVDPPARQPRGEAGILALLADRQRQLEVRHHDPRRPGLGSTTVTDTTFDGDSALRDEAGRVLGVVDDVDLLAGKLAHHVAHPLTHRADARAFGVDPRA